jgi:hypothetical protein
LKKDDGQIIKDRKELGDMTKDFFQHLYTSDPTVSPHDLLQLVEPIISEDMNAVLCKDFSSEEIADAIFQICPLKASGPDGFPAQFFQRNWEVMKHDVIRGVKEFFATGRMPPGVNDTAIVLNLKKDVPELLKDFRPISLCNVIYKVVTRCLVNRLRPLLHDIISPTQSAFVR